MTDWPPFQIQTYILELEQRGLVTRTFRRLDPDRQESVVRAILDEAVEKGPTSLNIKQVAERAGISVGSLYQYFGSRANLLAFAIQLTVKFTANLFESSRPYLVQMPLPEALAAYLSYGVEWSQTVTGFIQFFGKAAYQGDPQLAEQVVRPVSNTMLSIMRDLLAAARERGEIRPEIDLEATARVLNVLTIAAGDSQLLPTLNSYFQVTGEGVSFERAVQALVVLVMYGLAQPLSAEGVQPDA